MRRHLHAAASRIPFVAAPPGEQTSPPGSPYVWLDPSDTTTMTIVRDGTGGATTNDGDFCGRITSKGSNTVNFEDKGATYGWEARPVLDITSGVYSLERTTTPSVKSLVGVAVDAFPSKRGTVGLAYYVTGAAAFYTIAGSYAQVVEPNGWNWTVPITTNKYCIYDSVTRPLQANFVSLNTWHTAVITRDSDTNVILRLDGTEENVTIANATFNSGDMGYGNGTGSYYTTNLVGRTGPMVMYQTALSSGDRALLEDYLQYKVGL